MSSTNRFVLDDHNAVCFECGRKKKASTLMRNWKGYYVCPEHWEPRHPQDYVGPVPQPEIPAYVQSSQDTFIDDGLPEAVPYDPNV